MILSLTTLASLIVISSVMSGCNPGQTNRSSELSPAVSSPAASPSPQASPVPSGTPVKESGDTIIVIKDGSADIKFLESEYEDEPIFHSKFTSKHVVLDYIKVTASAYPTQPPSDYHFPDPKHEITVNTGGDDKDIVITGKNDKVELKFDRNVYKPTCSDHNYKFCNPDRHVWLIRIDKQPWRACNPIDKCIVEVHTKDER